MFGNRKIKKIMRECTKTDKPFEQFCAEQGIRLPPRPEAQPKKKRTVWVAFASAAAAAVLVLCVSLPFLLKPDKDGGGTGLPGIIQPEAKEYGEFDVDGVKITYEELSRDANLFLLDSSGIEAQGNVLKILTKEDGHICVGYRIQEVLFGFNLGDELFAFQIDYMIKTYAHFTHSGNDDFKNLNEEVIKNGVNYSYRLFESYGKTTAYVFFEKSGYKYYLTVTGFEGLTEINKDSIEKLINNAL